MLARTHISDELEAMGSPLATITLRPVFTVPQNYFETFPALILEKVKQLEATASEAEAVDRETKEISSLFGKIGKKMPYSVPEGYFDSLNIPATENGTQLSAPAKVISMESKRSSSFRFRLWYAAAAVAALVGLFALLNRFNGTTETAVPVANISAELPKVSEAEMSKYLENSPELVRVEPLSLAGLEDIDIEGMIKDLNDAELQQFIAENPRLTIEQFN